MLDVHTLFSSYLKIYFEKKLQNVPQDPAKNGTLLMEQEVVPGPGYNCTQSFPISVYCFTKCDYSDSKFPK